MSIDDMSFGKQIETKFVNFYFRISSFLHNRIFQVKMYNQLYNPTPNHDFS